MFVNFEINFFTIHKASLLGRVGQAVNDIKIKVLALNKSISSPFIWDEK